MRGEQIQPSSFQKIDFNESVAIARKKHKRLFVAIDNQRELNERIIHQLPIGREDYPKLLLSQLFSRASLAFESFTFLFERGLRSDALSASRIILESLFHAKALIADPEHISVMLYKDQEFQLEAFEAILEHSDSKIFSRDELNGEIQKVQAKQNAQKDKFKKTKNKKVKDLSVIRAIAENANLKAFYDSDYGHLCLASHPSLRDMQKIFMVNDEDKDAFLLQYGPSEKGFLMWSIKSMEYLNMIIDVVLDKFGIALDEVCLNLRREIYETANALTDDEEARKGKSTSEA